MAKKRNNQMLGGVRGRVEKAIASRPGKRTRGRKKGIASGAVSELRSAVDSIKGRVMTRDAKRSEAAKKGARTRKRNAEKRSAAARKGARTRARAGSR
jgi:hypothetical protein